MISALWLAVALPALASSWKTAAPAALPPGPFDPLSAAEIETAASVIRNSKIFSADIALPLLDIEEPDKDDVLDNRAGSRRAFAVVLDRSRNETSEAIIDLASKQVDSWRIIPGVQPNLTPADLKAAADLVRADSSWQEALRKRGLTAAQVYVEAAPAGTVGVTGAEGPRLARALSYRSDGSTDETARPLEGLVAVVDLSARKVTQLVDVSSAPVAQEAGDIPRTPPPAPKPQPKNPPPPAAPDFELSGHDVHWKNWRFHVALRPREGLVLRQVSYEDNGRQRPVLYRASVSETLTTYGSPDAIWAWRDRLEEGEIGLGASAVPQQPEIDAPDGASLLDAVLADETGKPYTIPRAVAVYERDGAVLWRQRFSSGAYESRRGKELVVSSIAAFDGENYAFNWIFRQDGSIRPEITVAGVPALKAVAPDVVQARTRYAGRISSTTVAPVHEHFFNYRLDFDVDGATNAVYEADARAAPAGRDNPFGNAVSWEETLLPSEKAARRDANPAAARRWIVRNPSSLNEIGQPVGYAVVPEDNRLPLTRPESPARKRAGFVNHALWVTAYDASQNFAAGDYPNQSRDWEGVERWSADDDSLDGRDIVLWYTIGLFHAPRPEDWPVLRATTAGFEIIPDGFFHRDPALDVPAWPKRPAERKKKG